MASQVTELKLAPPPVDLERIPLVQNKRSIGWISDQIAMVIEGKTPLWWKISFVISLGLLSLLGVCLTYLVGTGVGVWGVRHPIMWGWGIVNFVWWIGIGHAGTLISAILFLLRQKWRTGVNRAAEAMTIFAVMCAGIFPLFHVVPLSGAGIGTTQHCPAVWIRTCIWTSRPRVFAEAVAGPTKAGHAAPPS